MPYIADYLWQDVLAAAKKLTDGTSDLPADVLLDTLARAVEAAEGGSSTEGEAS